MLGRARRIFCISALAGLAFAGSAMASGQLVISPAPVGWHSAGNSVSAARAQLRAGLPRSLAKAVAHAQTEAAGAVTAKQRLASDGFIFAAPATAHRVLVAYRRAHHGRPLGLGSDGSFRKQRRGSSIRFTLVWRRGANVGLLQMQVPKRLQNGFAQVLAMARVADAALQPSPPSGAFAKVLDQVNSDGSVSPQVAIQAFALVYGSLPGVQVPGGDASQTPDGTGVGGWALSHISSYSRGTQNAIWSKLGLVPPGQAREATFGDAHFTEDPALKAIATGFAARYPGLLGTAALKYTLVVGTTTAFHGAKDPPAADTWPVDNAGHYNVNGPNCRIRYNADLNAPNAGGFKSITLAHEVFHCFQFMIAGNAWQGIPAWVLEGGAEWAAETLVQPAWGATYPNADSGLMLGNIQHPETPLFQRSYDAMDFWGHVQDVYGDLWSRWRAILTARGSTAMFKGAGGNNDTFLSSWASSLSDPVNTPFAAWHLKSPISVPDGSGVTHKLVTYNPSVPLSNILVPAYATKHLVLLDNAAAPLMHIKIRGHARFSKTHDYVTELKDGWFCTVNDPAACKCPAGEAGNVPAGYPTNGFNELEITGDPGTGTAVSVEYVPLSKFCKAVYTVPKK